VLIISPLLYSGLPSVHDSGSILPISVVLVFVAISGRQSIDYRWIRPLVPFVPTPMSSGSHPHKLPINLPPPSHPTTVDPYNQPTPVPLRRPLVLPPPTRYMSRVTTHEDLTAAQAEFDASYTVMRTAKDALLSAATVADRKIAAGILAEELVSSI
jgi:hypothetical protein